MHYIIADQIIKRVEIKDHNRFSLGTLAPDFASYMSADSHEKGIHAQAHFGETDFEEELRGINWTTFLDKYKTTILEDEFVMGYFVHLLSDALWLKQIQANYLYTYPMEERKAMVMKAYSDMGKSNSMLIDKYGIENKLTLVDSTDVEEAAIDYAQHLLNDFREDFVSGSQGDAGFEVYEYDAILSYIEKCVDKCVLEIEALRNGWEVGCHREFMLPMGM